MNENQRTSNRPISVGEQIRALGREVTPSSLSSVISLFADEQQSLAAQFPPVAVDVAYGEHERHLLDIYAPVGGTKDAPVVIWVHGGGFRRGGKGGGDVWQEAHVGRMAAAAGFVGVVINYRLAPQHPWPAGAEDLSLAVDWLKSNVEQFGGSPQQLVLSGTSAGAAHVAGYIKHRPDHASHVRGAILLSGVYGFTALDDERDRSYYGEDPALHAARTPAEALVNSALPLYVACAEFDPPRFQQEFVTLLQRRLEVHGALPDSYVVSGHNHFSLAYHLGSSDKRLHDEIVSFVRLNA